MLGRKKLTLAARRRGASRAARRACPCPTRTSSTTRGSSRRSPTGTEQAVFGLGCFWGAERKFLGRPGVYTTAVGYAGGSHAEPDVRGSVQRR